MTDRALIPLATAGMFGFLAGLLAAVLQLTGGQAFAVGAAAAGAAALAAIGSVAGVHADAGEITIVAVLRAGLAAALAVFIFLGMLAFLRDGQILLAFLLWIVAGVLAGLLAQLHVRDRAERRDGTRGHHGQTA